MKQIISIDGEYIELFRALKFARLVETGGQAKDVIRDGLVRVGDTVVQELRKKVRPGDHIFYGSDEIEITTK